MIILGIDPGSRLLGFGVIKIEGKKSEYIDSGTIHFDHIEEFMDRLAEIYNSCLFLIEKYQPDELSLESLIYVKNATSFGKLAQARGAILAAANQKHRGKIFEYAPNLVKSSVTGAGHASKESVQKSISMILKVNTFETADESDALAIALCHGINRNFKQAGTGSGAGHRRGNSLRQAFKHLK